MTTISATFILARGLNALVAISTVTWTLLINVLGHLTFDLPAMCHILWSNARGPVLRNKRQGKFTLCLLRTYHFHLGSLLLQPPLKEIKFMLPAQIAYLAKNLTSHKYGKTKDSFNFHGQWSTNLNYIFLLSQLCRFMYRPNAKTFSLSLLHNRDLCVAGYGWLRFGFKPWMGLGPA